MDTIASIALPNLPTLESSWRHTYYERRETLSIFLSHLSELSTVADARVNDLLARFSQADLTQPLPTFPKPVNGQKFTADDIDHLIFFCSNELHCYTDLKTSLECIMNRLEISVRGYGPDSLTHPTESGEWADHLLTSIHSTPTKKFSEIANELSGIRMSLVTYFDPLSKPNPKLSFDPTFWKEKTNQWLVARIQLAWLQDQLPLQST